jgi:hypothetical protein
LCTTTVDPDGFWSCELSELATGVHSLFAWAQDPADDTVSVDVPLSVFIGLGYNGVIRSGDLEGTPLEGVSISYESASTVSDSAGTFLLPVPDESGVTPVLSKRGWSFSLSSTESVEGGVIYRYSAVPALESRSYAIWDAATPGTTHILKLLNKGSSTQTPAVTLSSQDGAVCGALTGGAIAPMSDARIDLSASRCLSLGTVGVIAVTSGDAYDGEFESLVPRGGDVDIRTSGSMPLMNGLFGSSYATFDTGAAVLDKKLDKRFVENALIIGNVSDQTATFTVNYTRAGGGAYKTERVSISPRGVSRLVVGDVKQKAAVSGLVQITPDDTSLEYVAAMRRYGYSIVQNKKTKALEKGKTFYVMSEHARASDGGRFVARFDYASPLDAQSFLEFANTTNQPIGVTIEHTGLAVKSSKPPVKKGKKIPPQVVSKRSVVRVSVPPRGTQRVKFARFMKTSREGTVSIVSDVSDALLCNVVSHSYTPKKLLSASKLSVVTPSYGDEHHGFYESAPPSTILISNMASEQVTATVNCFVGGVLSNAVPLTIPAGGSVLSKMGACFGGTSVGVVQVNSSRAGALGVDRVELRKPSGASLRTRLR